MELFDIFKKKGTIAGEIVLRGLPSHKMYSVTITFFSVGSASSQPPFNGDPPPNKWRDTAPVKEAEEPDDKPLGFCFQRASGHYYLGIGVIAFLERDGKMFAQVERFFPMTRPCEIQAGIEQQIQLAVAWPDIPLNELNAYGIIHPAER